MRASLAVRSLRAAVFAAVCVLLAAAGHGLATGAAPPVWTPVAGFLAVFVLGCLMGGRERSQVGIGGAMLGTQAGLHVMFGAFRPLATARLHGALTAHAHAMVHSHVMGPTHAMTSHAAAAHIAAALLASWWLRRGEAALWTLLCWAVALVPGLAAWWRAPTSLLPAPVYVGAGCDAGPWSLRRFLLRHIVSRRGPPTENPYEFRPQHALNSTEFPSWPRRTALSGVPCAA
ncbi:hypothetical protein [Streptomyces sp. NPDC058228]|uniref:hypothetical protein n=1 Tax=Streptomyces sp. NPDC058228 TaxID=3346390 RepID=UPI0036E2DD31